MEKINSIVGKISKNIGWNSFFTILLCLSNILYITYLLLIGYHNVIISDDYWFMAEYKKYGIIGSLSYWYNYWQGRFGPQLLINIVVRGYELTKTLLPYTIILISTFIFTIHRLLNRLLELASVNKNYSKFLLYNLSAFIFNLFLIVNFEFSTFYWITVSTMYFGGILFALIGMIELISKSKSRTSYFLLVVGFIYAGSSAEHFGAIITLGLALYLGYLHYQKKITSPNSFNFLSLKKGWSAFIVCIICFLVMICAPGNEIRRQGYPSMSVFGASKIALQSLFYVFTILIPEKAKYLIILSFPIIYFGTLSRGNTSINESKTAWIVAGSIPLFTGFVYVCLVPTAYAVSGIGPFRALTHIAFFIVCYVVALSFFIGYKTLFSKQIAYVLAVVSCVCFLFVSREKIKINLPETIKYTQSEKSRIIKLVDFKRKGNRETVVLDSLYASSRNVLFYYEFAAELKNNPDSWINQCVGNGLNLGYRIKVNGK